MRHRWSMRQSRSSITLALLSGPAIGCAAPATFAPFNVVVRGPATSCSIEVEGRKVTTDELFEIAQPEARSGRRAHIDSDMAQTPYRCLGGAIYALQRAGFKDVGRVAASAVVRTARKWALPACPLVRPIGAGRLSGDPVGSEPPERHDVVDSCHRHAVVSRSHDRAGPDIFQEAERL